MIYHTHTISIHEDLNEIQIILSVGKSSFFESWPNKEACAEFRFGNMIWIPQDIYLHFLQIYGSHVRHVLGCLAQDPESRTLCECLHIQSYKQVRGFRHVITCMHRARHHADISS